MDSKDLQTASILNGGQQINQLKNNLEFIQKAMVIIISLRKIISRAARYKDDSICKCNKYSKTFIYKIAIQSNK